MDALVSTEWLQSQLGEPDLNIVDASWHMPASGRNGRAEFAAEHIPGAVFLDIDELRDVSSPTPHMLPAGAEFAAAMEELSEGGRLAQRLLGFRPQEDQAAQAGAAGAAGAASAEGASGTPPGAPPGTPASTGFPAAGAWSAVVRRGR